MIQVYREILLIRRQLLLPPDAFTNDVKVEPIPRSGALEYDAAAKVY
jgi:hypothetical protein